MSDSIDVDLLSNPDLLSDPNLLSDPDFLSSSSIDGIEESNNAESSIIDESTVTELLPLATPTTTVSTVKKDLPAEWGYILPEERKRLDKQLVNRKTRHGLLSSIPMICRADACHYKLHCLPWKNGEVTAGERCVLEIAKLMEASEAYYQEFQVDPQNPQERVDAILIQQLLTCEILIDRCNMLLASQDLVQEVDVAMNPQGDIISQPQLNKAAEALPKFQKQHNHLLNLLSATRKDKIAAASVTGVGIDVFTKQLLENAQLVEARLTLMRNGNLKEADEAGLKYGIDQHTRQQNLDATRNKIEPPTYEQ